MREEIDRAGEIPSGAVRLIGIGQSLRGDDAAGLTAVQLWQELYQAHGEHPEVQVESVELPGVDLLNLLEGATLAILVDAVSSGAQPGTIHKFSPQELDEFGVSSGSAHGWGVAETLALGRQLSPSSLPAHITIIGLELADITPGAALSPQVEAAMAGAAHMIEEVILEAGV